MRTNVHGGAGVGGTGVGASVGTGVGGIVSSFGVGTGVGKGVGGGVGIVTAHFDCPAPRVLLPTGHRVHFVGPSA